MHLFDKDWIHSVAEGTCQGDSSRCGAACFVPCFFLHSLARLAQATENYPEALLAWAACGSGDSKCFTLLENSLVGSVVICLQSCSKFSPTLASASPQFLMLAFWGIETFWAFFTYVLLTFALFSSFLNLIPFWFLPPSRGRTAVINTV